MARDLPFEIEQSLVDTLGRVFWFKDVFLRFLLKAGVPRNLVVRDFSNKFDHVRQILTALGSAPDGFDVKRRLLSETVRLSGLPDGGLPSDRRADAERALRHLKDLVRLNDEPAREDRRTADFAASRAKIDEAAQRTRVRSELGASFLELAKSEDRQDRGYRLELLLADLFESHGVPYRRPYSLRGEQIDGAFTFEGLDYLVECRWRQDRADPGDLDRLTAKATRKLDSTRGVFVSMAGFSADAVVLQTQVGGRVILFDGSDIALLFEDRISVSGALAVKVRAAAQRGHPFAPLRDYLG